VNRSFLSKTYEIQLDKIIDDIYLASVRYADNKGSELESYNTASLQASRTAAKDKPLPITAEAIKQTKALSGDAAESVTRWLKDEGLYTQHPDQLARLVPDLWDGEKYKARRFAITFTADVAENTAVHRYASLGIEYLQFYAEVDDRTTPQCRQFHGTIIPSNSLDVQRYRPPLHHHCRSCLIPATSKTLEDKDLLIENRDFTQHYSQDFTPLKMRTDIEQVNEVLKDIGKFNEKYRIDQFILDEDIQLRLMKLNLSIAPELPGKTTLKDFIKPDKTEPKTDPAKVENIIQKHEDKIKARKTEKAFVFDKDGNIILEKAGGKHSIGFTDEEAAKFENAIFIHNHPGGAPFSAVDIETACKNRLNEIRAVGEKGTYIMKMKSGENFNPDIWPEIKEEFSVNYDKELINLKARLKKGELKDKTNEELNQIFQVEAWKQTAEKITALDYTYIIK
jgi:SPP1 gp7 family putative phage head morphogenesis protein